jgi:hypothetical protein
MLQESNEESLKLLKVEFVVLPDPFLSQHVLKKLWVVLYVELFDACLA